MENSNLLPVDYSLDDSYFDEDGSGEISSLGPARLREDGLDSPTLLREVLDSMARSHRKRMLEYGAEPEERES